MKMLLHHQKRRNFSDGTFVYIGEDGNPYADSELLIVADGLGGRGGYPHKKIAPEILYPDKLYKDFIEPILKNSDSLNVDSDPRYAEYKKFVEDSFTELFELGEWGYGPTSARMRTSGYFASRLVTAIALYAVKFCEEFNGKALFQKINNSEGDAQKKYIDEFRRALAQYIEKTLFNIAQKMGLELESNVKGAYLLPTTLVIAIINDSSENVLREEIRIESGEARNGWLDVLYLWAGDSRGYLWNETEGLAQITDDHERDETMTNLITLTRPFELEARLIKVDKPVILFNATDGCYKCPCFASPFDLEYVFLQALAKPDNSDSTVDCFDAVAQELDNQFKFIGTHDDSNTMALTALGYESFDEIQNAANKRLGYLQKSIIDKLPEILDRDFAYELNLCERKIEDCDKELVLLVDKEMQKCDNDTAVLSECPSEFENAEVCECDAIQADSGTRETPRAKSEKLAKERDQLNKEYIELEKNLKTRQELYEKYEESYYRFFERSKLHEESKS